MLRSSIRRAVAVLASATLALSFAAGSAHAASVTITNNNCSSFNWDASTSTLTCVTGSTSGVPSCSINASPTSLAVGGGSVTLSMNCSNSPTSYAWGGASYTTQSGNTATANITATTAFTGTASNGAGTSATASKTVSVSTGGGGGGGGGAISCPGFNATHVIEESWTSPVRTPSAMGGNDAIVVHFQTGSGSSTLGSLSSIGAAEWGSSPSWRIGTLSTVPCDFGGVGATVVARQEATSEITVSFTVGTQYKAYPLLQTNTDYYLNIMNYTPSTCQSTGVCSMSALLVKKGVQ